MDPKQIVHSDPEIVSGTPVFVGTRVPLLTADRRLQFQQNLARFEIGIVVILTLNLRFRTIRAAIEPIRSALAIVRPGELIQVQVP